MKQKIILFIFIMTFSFILNAQIEIDNNDYGWGKRFSFMVGGGISVVSNQLYLDPVINKTNNAVIIEEGGTLKPNLTLGIIFTPKVFDITRKVKMVENNEVKEKILIEHYPRKWSYALYLNPVSLSNISSNSLVNTVDLGLGIGWREGNFAFFLTNEYFSIRQPRDYFIEQFKDNDTPYVINGEIQNSIDINDNNIFKNKIGVSFGIKMTYTFDVVKSYYSQSQELATSSNKEN